MRQALERGASDEEIKKLTDDLRAALDKFMQALAEQMRKNPEMAQRPLDRNARTLRPQEIHFYPHVDDVPVRALDPRQRALIALASVNLQIASRHWAFSSATLDALIDRGLAFPHVTQASLQVCQERFVRTSERLREYHAAYGHLMPQRSRTVDMTPTQGEVSHA